MSGGGRPFGGWGPAEIFGKRAGRNAGGPAVVSSPVHSLRSQAYCGLSGGLAVRLRDPLDESAFLGARNPDKSLVDVQPARRSSGGQLGEGQWFLPLQVESAEEEVA